MAVATPRRYHALPPQSGKEVTAAGEYVGALGVGEREVDQKCNKERKPRSWVRINSLRGTFRQPASRVFEAEGTVIHRLAEER